MARQSFNREPYFDDFDASKNFYKVLFRPSRSIQTRELNQLQSILQNQTEVFADHMFKFGSMVKSGTVDYQTHAPYVRLKDLNLAGDAIDLTLFRGRIVQGVTSGLRAVVVITTDKDAVDPATLYVQYQNTAIDGETMAFVDGETIQVLDDQGYAIYEAVVRCPGCTSDPDADSIDPTGFGSTFAINESTYYIHGQMVPSTYQVIVLDKYTTEPNYKVGFDIVQTVVTSDTDISLLDNSLGTPNFSAPGADRYRIVLSLSKKPIDDTDDDNFVLLARIEGGFLQKVNDKPQYAEIMDTIARRTYDESGDYTVKPFRLNFREHLDTGTNDGWKTAANGGLEEKFISVVSEGKAYVRGREIERIADSAMEFDKARDSDFVRSSVIRSYIGNYITIEMDSVGNVLPLSDVTSSDDFASDYEKVNFYDGASAGGNYTGNQIGTARVKSIEILSGTAGVDAVYALYIFEVVMGAGKTIQDVVGLHRTGGGDQTFSANIVPDVSDDTTNKIYDPKNNKLIWALPYKYVKSVRDADNPLVSNTSVVVTKKLVGAINSGNKVIFSAEGDETFLDYDSGKWVCGLQTAGAGGNFVEYDISATDVLVATPSEITIQNFNAAHVGKNVVLTCEVVKSNAKEKSKVLTVEYMSGIPADVSTINLLKSDIYKIVSISNVSDAENPIDVTANYVLDKGVKDNYYALGSLTLRAGVTVPDAGDELDIEFQYFQHTGNGYYFSVDSYTGAINDEQLDFAYEDIPSYTSTDGTVYRLSDSMDFRPSMGADGTFSGTGAVLSNMPIDNSNIIFDIEHYLSRIDLLCLREDGDFVIVKGDPSLTPKAPPAAEGSMALYRIVMNPYTFDLLDDVRMMYLDNRRYTMRDIGKLEKRIKNLEYYVTFNLLEKATADQQILDADGNNRFKNGFLVDNFRDFISSATDSGEYSVALDTEKGEMRPSFASKSVKIELDEANSDHFQQSSKVITLPFTQTPWMEQPFATKTLSVNPFYVFAVEGQMFLTPDNDVWKDSVTGPNIVNSIDTGFEALSEVASAAGVLGTTWGSWSNDSTEETVEMNGFIRNTTAVTEQSRAGVNRTIERNVQNVNIGTFVTDVNMIPFCRSTPVEFIATGMKPNTRVYAFFDDVNVDAETRPFGGSNNDPLVTDGNGDVSGVFTIPNTPTKRFFTGSRLFRLSNSLRDSTDPDELTTTAKAQFFAGGLSTTKSATILAVSTPRVVSDSVSTNRRTVRTTSVNTEPRQPPPDEPPRRDPPLLEEPPGPWRPIEGLGLDPVAQSFTVADEKGVFLTSCDILFSAKDAVLPVWFEIRDTVNGYPGPNVVPFTHCEIKSADVSVSDDANTATTFSFQAPAYLQSDTEYCFVVGSDSKEYRVYVSRLGGQTIGNNPVTVSTQPHSGSLFKSQNNTTWSAEQYEDIMFLLRRAHFDVSENMQLELTNNDVNLKQKLPVNPIETESGSRDVRIHFKNHGLAVNDKFHLEMLQETPYEIYLASGNLVVGQEIVGGTNAGTAIIKSMEHPGADGAGNDVYIVVLEDLNGKFDDGEQFTGQVVYDTFTDTDLLLTLGHTPRQLVHNVAVGSFPTGVDNTFNGVPLDDLSSPDHLVQAVDHMDSFIIQVATEATATGRAGGDGNYSMGNIQVDAFELQLQYLDFTGEGKFTVSGVSHAAVGSNLSDYVAVGPYKFLANETFNLTSPMKIANTINEGIKLGGSKSMVVTATLGSDDVYISPVLNLETSSFAVVTNRVDWNGCVNYSVGPGADTEGGSVICDSTDPGYTGTHRWVDETEASGGTETAKYIMKPVNLAQPATNIKIYVDLLDFLDTEIVMYYRTLVSESDEVITSVDWVRANFDAEVVSETEDDFREAEATIPEAWLEALPEFKAFQIKLVLRAKNTAKPPKVKNFRAVAVI